MRRTADWFLAAEERGNPATSIDRDRPDGVAWTEGNRVEPLIHGAPYFARLTRCLSELREGDRVMIADWRGDHDELLGPGGPTLGDLLCDLARRGVHVRGLLWRSHPKRFGFNQEEDRELVRVVNGAGGELLLDERVRRGGSHHQKLVALLHRDRPGDDVAFVGGIDLCHGRRDDERHDGDPQAERLDPVYGDRPPWHDIQAEVRGPAVVDLVETFRERWNDPTPLDRQNAHLGRLWPRAPGDPPAEPLPPLATPSPVAGGQAVQVLRTYPSKRPRYPFAPDGERSIARIYRKALARARSLIYVEDQYFWSEEIAALYDEALRRAPELRIIVVVPRHPDRDGTFSGPANRLGQLAMIGRLAEAGGDRVAVYDLENEHGAAIYVHAKVVVIDDVFAMVGSDNMNRRSWTHDSELSIAVLDGERDRRAPADPGGLGDGARVFARDLRLRLWREHLGEAPGGDALIDGAAAFERWRERASALDSWHELGRRGLRPPGRIRRHRPQPVAAWQRVWARPLYRTVVDPDGRPFALRRSHTF